MMKKLLALTLLASISTAIFAAEIKQVEAFDFKYKAQVIQSVVFGTTKAMKAGDELYSSTATGAFAGMGTGAALAAMNGAYMQGIVNGAAGGLVIGIAGGAIAGGIVSAINSSTLECMDRATNNGEKFECASTTWPHISQLIQQAGLVWSDAYLTYIDLNLDNTIQHRSGFGGPALPQTLADGSPAIRFTFANSEAVPTVVTIKGQYRGEEYAAKYPESRGYEWAISDVQKYNKPLVIRGAAILDWNEKAATFLNDPANFAKS
jgi:hypothetical protein